MVNVICTINNTRVKLATDKASSWTIWLQELDFSNVIGKTYSQQKRGFRNWCADLKKKNTKHSIFHDLELEMWGNQLKKKT